MNTSGGHGADACEAAASAIPALVREVLTHHVLEVSADPVFVIDGDGSVLVANRAAQRLGWTVPQFAGRRWDDVIVAEYLSESTHILSSNVAASVPGVAVARAARVRRPDGTVDEVRLVTYRLWLSGTAPCVVIVEGRRDRALCLAGAR